jgi:hypothetical protein
VLELVELEQSTAVLPPRDPFAVNGELKARILALSG